MLMLCPLFAPIWKSAANEFVWPAGPVTDNTMSFPAAPGLAAVIVNSYAAVLIRVTPVTPSLIIASIISSLVLNPAISIPVLTIQPSASWLWEIIGIKASKV